MEPTCTIHEFASRNEVTVRALHYYDRIGLLCPTRNVSGYRRYSAADTGRLQQILALRWVGLSLKEIRRLVSDESADITEALHRRRTQIEETQRRLNGVISAIEQTGLLAAPGAGDSRQPEQIIKVVCLNWAMARLNLAPEPAGLLAQKTKEWKSQFTMGHSAEEIASMKKESADLFREAAEAFGEDPAGLAGKSIAARYRQLVARQCEGKPDLLASTLDLHRRIPVFPNGLGLDSRLENFSNKAWVFIGKALDASRS
jgi:DNA-binding transcriptional MerR regulator